MKVLCEISPQPPEGIKYMLGDESWLTPERRTPLHLHCEEWGNLGPLELNREIQPNGAGFRVRTSKFFAPEGADGYVQIEGKYYWAASTQEGASNARD